MVWGMGMGRGVMGMGIVIGRQRVRGGRGRRWRGQKVVGGSGAGAEQRDGSLWLLVGQEIKVMLRLLLLLGSAAEESCGGGRGCGRGDEYGGRGGGIRVESRGRQRCR